jgi:hypothetical protein
MLKRFIFWEYQRGSWQYDIIVGLILAFLLLTPRAWFRDQPRIAKASDIALLSSANGVSEFFVQKDNVASASAGDGQRVGKVTEQLRIKTGDKRLTVSRLEPVKDSEGELQGYVAYARH